MSTVVGSPKGFETLSLLQYPDIGRRGSPTPRWISTVCSAGVPAGVETTGQSQSEIWAVQQVHLNSLGAIRQNVNSTFKGALR